MARGAKRGMRSVKPTPNFSPRRGEHRDLATPALTRKEHRRHENSEQGDAESCPEDRGADVRRTRAGPRRHQERTHPKRTQRRHQDGRRRRRQASMSHRRREGPEAPSSFLCLANSTIESRSCLPGRRVRRTELREDVYIAAGLPPGERTEDAHRHHQIRPAACTSSRSARRGARTRNITASVKIRLFQIFFDASFDV